MEPKKLKGGLVQIIFFFSWVTIIRLEVLMVRGVHQLWMDPSPWCYHPKFPSLLAEGLRRSAHSGSSKPPTMTQPETTIETTGVNHIRWIKINDLPTWFENQSVYHRYQTMFGVFCLEQTSHVWMDGHWLKRRRRIGNMNNRKIARTGPS